MKIFIVVGTTGEYSDRSEWNVAAYQRKELAEMHVEAALKALVPAQGYGAGRPTLSYSERDRFFKSNIWDPGGRMDYTGVEYYVTEVEVFDALPNNQTEE